MNTDWITTIHITAARMLASASMLAAAAMTLASCGVTAPDEIRWKDVSAYSWPADTVTTMQYKIVAHDNINNTTDTTLADISTALSTTMYRGVPMYSLREKGGNASLRKLFLPLKDTLITKNLEFDVRYALVAPLEKGHSWICTYADDAETEPSWRAKVIERFAYRKVEGNVYRNVIEVEYTPLIINPNGHASTWVQFYAEGIGVVQTIQNSIRDQADPVVESERVLVRSSAQQN
jgi:hypothetical protein